MTYVVTSTELYHHGILGQKWGVRRFQNPDGTLTEAGKKRYGTVENLEARKTLKQIKRHENAKQEAIASGNTERIQKFSKELTKEEMEKAFRRIDEEQKLTQLRQKDIVLGKEKLQNIIDVGGKIKSAAEVVTQIYNLGAEAHNAFSDGPEWPVIGKEKKKASNIDEETKKFNLDREKWRFAQERARAANKDAEKVKAKTDNKENSEKAGNTEKGNKSNSEKSKDYSDGEYHQKYREASNNPPRALPENDSSYSYKYREATPRNTAGYLPSSDHYMTPSSGSNRPISGGPRPSSSGGGTPSRFNGKPVIDVDYEPVARTPVAALPPHSSNTNASAKKVVSNAGSTRTSSFKNKSAADLMKENGDLLNQMYKDLLD